MIVFVNDRNEIKDVDSTTDASLFSVEINDENNPFKDWTKAKICCFKVEVTDGNVTMFTPYVNTEIIERLDKLAVLTEGSVTDIELAITELYELVLGGV
jgi:hypothetical protein